MKRSIAVSLVLMGTASALAGCDEEKFVDTAVWSTVEECVLSGKYNAETCENHQKVAAEAHAKNAPAYKKKEDCEAEFGAGKCDDQTSPTHAAGSNFFVPLMMGYMMGGRSVGPEPAVAGPQALYRQAGKSEFMNSNGATVARSTGPMKLGNHTQAFKAPSAQTKTLSRGGFGARSMSVSS